MIIYTKEKGNGIFEQYGKLYEFSMKILQTGIKIKGEIGDFFGEATFKGTFTNSEFKFLKSYYSGISVGIDFMYEGIHDPSVNKISGRWHSPVNPSNNGEFWLDLKKK